MNIEKAKISDAEQIHKLINHFASNGEMLARSLSEIYENIRDYFVIRDDKQLIACVALHVFWKDLAEIKSLAVNEESQRKGMGDRLIEVCLKEARELNIPSVFCLTYKPDFFAKCGFSEIDKDELPQKIWTECFRCPKYPDCDEIALIYNFETGE
ncbi:N-acetyltransferase [Chloroflexota bacterium]